jgi:methionyl-tRNA formyltransferase
MSLRIVFLGTPEFATTSLNALLQSKHEVVGVVTAPDKPAGRGQQLNESDVKKLAVQHELKLFQPEKLRNEHFIQELKNLNADLFVVVAFRMLPEVVWNMPRLGTLNLHGSLLPQYRGAAPIQWAVMNGETETGCTTFRLKHEIDTGEVLGQHKMSIAPNETAGELYERMMHEGADLLVRTLDLLEEEKVEPIDQEKLITSELKHAPKLLKEDGRVRLTDTPAVVHNRVRGVTPFPGAFTTFQGKILKIHKGLPEETEHSFELGSFHSDNKTFLKLAVNGGFYNLFEVQLEGKKRMAADEFLRGVNIPL